VFYELVSHSVAIAFAAATLAWLVVSVTAWWLRRKLRAGSSPSKRIDSHHTDRPARDPVQDRGRPVVSSPRR